MAFARSCSREQYSAFSFQSTVSRRNRGIVSIGRYGTSCELTDRRKRKLLRGEMTVGQNLPPAQRNSPSPSYPSAPGSSTPPPSSPPVSTAPSPAKADQAGCSRQTVYQHAHKLEQRLEPAWSQAARALESFDADRRLNGRIPGLHQDCRGAEGFRWPGVAEGPALPDRPAGPGFPGPDAPSVGGGRSGRRWPSGGGAGTVGSAGRTR